MGVRLLRKAFLHGLFYQRGRESAFDKMQRETDYVLCPEHYKDGVFGIE